MLFLINDDGKKQEKKSSPGCTYKLLVFFLFVFHLLKVKREVGGATKGESGSKTQSLSHGTWPGGRIR